MGGRDDIWYATNIEICDYAEAFGRLYFSADGNLVHNPTAIDLWGTDGEKTVKIPSGGTVSLK